VQELVDGTPDHTFLLKWFFFKTTQPNKENFVTVATY
jgi:hypothetical protein